MCTALDELIESGKEKLLTEMVEKKLAKNKTPDTIADELETDISIINNIIEKIEKSAPPAPPRPPPPPPPHIMVILSITSCK